MFTASFKSSPLLEEPSKAGRSSKSSRRSSRQRDSNEYQFRKVANPFLSQQQEKFLPAGLLKEVGQMEFITPHLVQNISWKQVVSVPRRSSIFAKQLQAMQRAVREQEQRSRTVIDTKKKGRVCFQEMQEQKSISIEQNVQQQQEGVSLGMHDWFEAERMQNEEFFIDNNLEQEVPIFYYSQNNIQPNSQDLDDYFYL